MGKRTGVLFDVLVGEATTNSTHQGLHKCTRVAPLCVVDV